MALSQRIAFVGAGNMASALIEGLLAAGTCVAERITASDVREDALAALRGKHGISTSQDNAALAATADVVVLSVKPQVLPAVLVALGPVLDARKLVLSIAAGVPLSVIEASLPSGARAVRAMPNTPALVRAGATAIAAGTYATGADMDVAEAIFRSVGVVERVPETQLDAVTALSGSGPAYVFLLCEALTDAGISVGLSASTAAVLAAQTVYGAGKLLHESAEGPAALRARVSSPGGTTVAGLERLAKRDFAGVVADAVRRATERAQELGIAAATKLGKG
ncbi:MAG: pyrroline-5-carboxylate reductase [Polyangiales bacterium]